MHILRGDFVVLETEQGWEIYPLFAEKSCQVSGCDMQYQFAN